MNLMMMSHSKTNLLASGVLNITPKPTPRVRVTVRAGHGVAYYKADYKHYLEEIAAQLSALGIPTTERLLRVDVGFFMIRARTSKLIVPTPDIDNLAKGFLDGLQQSGIMKNDKQVVYLEAEKRFHSEDQITFEIYELDYE